MDRGQSGWVGRWGYIARVADDVRSWRDGWADGLIEDGDSRQMVDPGQVDK